MEKFVNLIKLIFFIWSVFLSIVVLRGDYIFGDKQELILKILMPWFWILMGMSLGSIIGEIVLLKNDIKPTDSIADNVLLKSYIVWWILWGIIWAVYIFLG